jgi:Tol biopolymer transport system component
LNPECPVELERIIHKALEKDRDIRYQVASELRVDLRRLKRDTDSDKAAVAKVAPGVVQRRTAGRWLVLSALGLALLLGLAGWYFLRRGSQMSPGPVSAKPFTSMPGYEGGASFSPDGNQITFGWDSKEGSNSDIYIKMIGTETMFRLTNGPAAECCPLWSPDGRQIAFMRSSELGDAIYAISPLGGLEHKLHEVRDGGTGYCWSPDGKSLAVSERDSQKTPYGIFLPSLETLQAKALTSPPNGLLGDGWPAFSPNGQTLAFARNSTYSVADIWLQPVSGGEARRLTFERFTLIFGIAWTADGQGLVFSAQAGSAGSPTLYWLSASGGTPQRIPGIGEGAVLPFISRQGNRLAYTSETQIKSSIWRLPGPKCLTPSRSPESKISSTRQDFNPHFSPDGRKIAFESDRTGQLNIWVCDLDGSHPTQLTDLKGDTGTPRWSPDSKQLAFDSRPGEDGEIYVISAEGGSPRRLTNDKADDVTPSWSRDGKWIYFSSDRSGRYQVWKMSAKGGPATQVTHGGGSYALESLDGKWLYFSKRGATFSGPGDGLWKVPTGGGEEVRILDRKVYRGSWDLAAGGIYFLTKKPKAGGEEWSIERLSLETGKVTPIFQQESPNSHVFLAVSHDEQWILYSEYLPQEGDLMLVENFR